MEKVKHEFKISYELTSTVNHTISAEVLGKSLINMSDLLKESNKILNGEASTTEIEVKAHEPGSFVIDVVAWLDSGGIDILQTLGITSLVGAAAAGNFFAAIKATKNRILKEKVTNDNGTYTLKFEDGDDVICDENVNKLLNSHSVRTKLDAVINKPTSGDDEAKVTFFDVDTTTDKVTETAVIESAEIEYFKAPPRKIFATEETDEKETEVVFTVVSLEKKTGWKMRIGNGEEVAVRMEDEAFLERISQRKSAFIKGDLFVVRLRTVEKEIDGKSTLTRSIMRVIRHRVDIDKKVIEDEPRG